MLLYHRQACSPLIQLFFGFASDIDQTNINRDIRDGNWLSTLPRVMLMMTTALTTIEEDGGGVVDI